jgi:biotin/methionine sulfoxide reductase
MPATRGYVRTHWGLYEAAGDGAGLTEIRPFVEDPDPSDIGRSLHDSLDHPARVRRPAIRRGWLEGRPDSGRLRGRDTFIEVDWEQALDCVAAELNRVRTTWGNGAIFGGSYGWASAGRFHHAQSQLHRFLNTIGGYCAHRFSYSAGAAHAIMPHVLGYGFNALLERHSPSWPVIARHTRLFVMCGGLAPKNAQVTPGGSGRHETTTWLGRCRDAGARFVSISPVRTDTWSGLDAEWLPVRPNTDTALMLGIAHVLETEGLADRAFLASHCVGYERFRPYLLGESDGVPKDPAWAEAICSVPADRIVRLAREMARARCLITVTWSLQRAENGEQPFWMATVLAAMLGQIGLPGGGIAFGFGSMGGYGNPIRPVMGLALPQGTNRVKDFIPVARIADMLLDPGGTYRFDGATRTYPHIRLVYWCGGNPFHHHQDLNRLREAWTRPETIIVHEPWWTATARHADIVLPAAAPLERNDIGRAAWDPHVVAMKAFAPPLDRARTDYAIFSALAERLQVARAFTEGRDEMGWLRHLYETFRLDVDPSGGAMPDFDRFWEKGLVRLDIERAELAVNGFDAFRADPATARLPTPSGRIVIFSETIAGFGAEAGHPRWIPPEEWLGSPAAARYPLHLLSPQPAGRLHSQLDFGRASAERKLAGREQVLISASDAARRGISHGAVVRIFNDRGSCLAAAHVTDAVMPGVVSLPTGAWYDPVFAPDGSVVLDRHGNPNVLTPDRGTSENGQGCSANSALVEVELYRGPPAPVQAFQPPDLRTLTAE